MYHCYLLTLNPKYKTKKKKTKKETTTTHKKLTKSGQENDINIKS